MHQNIAILGRQPALSILELESVYGATSIQPFGKQACLIRDASEVPFTQLGGSTRMADVIAKIPNEWPAIERYLQDKLPALRGGEGKITFGLSVFGVAAPPKKVAATALRLKKALKASGRSVRMVPHKQSQLGTAVVLHNNLTGGNGWELLIVSDGKSTYLARTTAVQDIDAYAARDQARPYRDAKVGMLPPKLAQIIINAAAIRSDQKVQVLDPFCGTGVVLQEAMLMDYDIYGTDLEPRMIDYSIKNLEWLDRAYPNVGDYRRVEVGDATNHKWNNPAAITAVACETYLGQPLRSLPPKDQLDKNISFVDKLHRDFLRNIGTQITSGTRLCLAVPAWKVKSGFRHLPMLASTDDLGYNDVSFEHVSAQDLTYHREGQIVGRHLLVLEKK